MYDLRADPHEIRNLAGEGAGAAMLKTMRRELDAHMIAINDNGFLPEGMDGEGYAESRDAGVYPLKQAMALAAVAARGDPRDLERLRTALAGPVPVLRYWAATGLLILGKAAAPAMDALQKAMRDDPAPHVRIVAAEAVAGIATTEEPVRALAAIVDEAPSWQLELQAVNALTYIGGSASLVLPSIQRAALSEQEYVQRASSYLVAVLTGTYSPTKPTFDVERMMQGFAKRRGAD